SVGLLGSGGQCGGRTWTFSARQIAVSQSRPSPERMWPSVRTSRSAAGSGGARGRPDRGGVLGGVGVGHLGVGHLESRVREQSSSRRQMYPAIRLVTLG